MRRLLAVSILSITLSGCATWSNSSVTPPSNAATPSPTPVVAKVATDILVTESDISDRKYETLGDIEATVNKTTLFNQDPTPALVAEKLREEAAALGADAVVLTRYGTVGVSLMSWGSLTGTGRAVRFVE